MKINRKIFVILLALLLGLLAGCQAGQKPVPPLPEQTAAEAAQKLVAELQNVRSDNESSIEALPELFFDYYVSTDEHCRHNYELAALPQFVKGEEPAWDEVSHWLCYFCPYDPETCSWAAADFDEAAAVLLPDYTVPRTDSAYLTYDPENERFVATGWDENGSQYYKLSGIAWSGDEFEVHFYVCDIDELWADEVYASTSANDGALQDYALRHGYNQENMYELDVTAAMRDLMFGRPLKGEQSLQEIFFGDDNEQLLYRTMLKVRFRLSGDESLPFTYLAAEREILL